MSKEKFVKDISLNLNYASRFKLIQVQSFSSLP